MSLHTGRYEVLTRNAVEGHKKGEIFEYTAEKAIIGVLVTSGVIRAVQSNEPGEAGTEKGVK